ncbi:hypothetical protein R3P38DRAFT_2805095 [Favolaschia claudopus]|uniref:Uncharacterized protein n=1 Tax=Favolaschia claudopus TaxID=2862362 RepID=A0AAV9ZPI2_9AGAR
MGALSEDAEKRAGSAFSGAESGKKPGVAEERAGIFFRPMGPRRVGSADGGVTNRETAQRELTEGTEKRAGAHFQVLMGMLRLVPRSAEKGRERWGNPKTADERGGVFAEKSAPSVIATIFVEQGNLLGNNYHSFGPQNQMGNAPKPPQRAWTLYCLLGKQLVYILGLGLLVVGEDLANCGFGVQYYPSQVRHVL